MIVILMTDVAKVLVVDQDDNYLMMMRSNHPLFPYDWDLPGGEIEPHENITEGVARELFEEAGIEVNADDLELLCRDSKYSAEGTAYDLYVCRVADRPDVKISWEHAGFEWVRPDDCVSRARHAIDNYMHMVSEALSGPREHA